MNVRSAGIYFIDILLLELRLPQNKIEMEVQFLILLYLEGTSSCQDM
jgi:hypothetical protein